MWGKKVEYAYAGFAIKVVVHVIVLRKYNILTTHFRDPQKFSEEDVVCVFIFNSILLEISRATSKSTHNLLENLESPTYSELLPFLL